MSLREITGIGASKEKDLQRLGINTIADLAKIQEPALSTMSIPNIKNLVVRAQQYMTANNPAVETIEEQKIVEAEIEEKKKEEERVLALFLETHSWFQHKVLIPDEDELKEAIIWDLSLEPNERIAFHCHWVEPDQLCEMTFSPQLLLHFNRRLPNLEIEMNDKDFAALPNKETINNLLQEVRFMQLF